MGMTWVVWKWATTPFISAHFEITNGAVHSSIYGTRNNAFLSYWALYIFTTGMKLLCCRLVDIPDDHWLFDGESLQRMIALLVEIMFAFGLKFVFTNIEEWTPFIAVSVMNA